jgi:hypothetical protein
LNPRNVSRYATTTPGLSEFQQKLVAEAAEAFSRVVTSQGDCSATSYHGCATAGSSTRTTTGTTTFVAAAAVCGGSPSFHGRCRIQGKS